MAGPHQIWKMPLDGREIGPYAGNGREDIADGPLLPKRPYATGFASFAQPSGLASDGERLFVADSEGSAIRAVPFDPDGQSGDARRRARARCSISATSTASASKVRLQHPLGVAFHDGKLYVADTYNNKIKVLDVATRDLPDDRRHGQGRRRGRGRRQWTPRSTSRPASPRPAASSTSPTRTITRFASWSWHRRIGCRRSRLRGLASSR